jgi:hypothetical protein
VQDSITLVVGDRDVPLVAGDMGFLVDETPGGVIALGRKLTLFFAKQDEVAAPESPEEGRGELFVVRSKRSCNQGRGPGAGRSPLGSGSGAGTMEKHGNLPKLEGRETPQVAVLDPTRKDPGFRTPHLGRLAARHLAARPAERGKPHYSLDLGRMSQPTPLVSESQEEAARWFCETKSRDVYPQSTLGNRNACAETASHSMAPEIHITFLPSRLRTSFPHHLPNIRFSCGFLALIFLSICFVVRFSVFSRHGFLR